MKKNYLKNYRVNRLIGLICIISVAIVCQAQNSYTEPVKAFKNGALVETYSNETLQISVSVSVEKVFNNAKEIFYNIIVVPKKDNVTLIVDDIKATGITSSNKEKNLEIYDYNSYKSKLKRNILLWGPNANNTTTIKTDVNTQTQGSISGNTTGSGTVNYNTGYANVSSNSQGNYNYSENKTVTATTKITEPNPIFYETRKNADVFAEGYLRSNTANQGSFINGFIVTKYSKLKEVKLIIPINNSVYHFNFTL